LKRLPNDDFDLFFLKVKQEFIILQKKKQEFY